MPTGRVLLSLRRFVFSDKPHGPCPETASVMRSHDSSVPIGEAPARPTPEHPDYRDVDVRCILRDEEFARLFGDCAAMPQYSALWSMMCTGIGLWLSEQTGLPVDFQIQQMTAANAEWPKGKRHPLGVFKNPNPPDYSSTAAADGAQKI